VYDLDGRIQLVPVSGRAQRFVVGGRPYSAVLELTSVSGPKAMRWRGHGEWSWVPNGVRHVCVGRVRTPEEAPELSCTGTAYVKAQWALSKKKAQWAAHID
jgi:hypothetical protein